MTTCEFIITIIVSVVFSDVAAVITTLIYQNHKAKKARLTVLRALANEVERIRKVVEHNGQLKVMDTVQPVTRMPMVAFETAFVSGEPGLDVSDGLCRRSRTTLLVLPLLTRLLKLMLLLHPVLPVLPHASWVLKALATAATLYSR